MVRGVIPKLGEGDSLNPLGGARVSEAAQICFEALIYPLGLAVCLWVVGCAHAQACTGHAEQSLLKCTGKNMVAIRDDSEGHTVQSVDVVHEEAGNSCSGEWVVQRDKMCEF